jgi:hypothetical protein
LAERKNGHAGNILVGDGRIFVERRTPTDTETDTKRVTPNYEEL